MASCHQKVPSGNGSRGEGKNDKMRIPNYRQRSRLKNHPVLTIIIAGKLHKSNQSKYYFGFNKKKSYLQASVLGFVDNFEQHFESCVLKIQNSLKRALNKVNGLNTSKN